MLPVVGAVRPRATAAIAGRSFATQITRGLRSYRPNSVLGGKRKEPRLKMEAQMAIPQWHDLTQEEQQAIAELYTGFTSLLTACMAERLKALGLAEQKVGGTGLTEQGRELFESR
jgi:hypothetical protein